MRAILGLFFCTATVLGKTMTMVKHKKGAVTPNPVGFKSGQAEDEVLTSVYAILYIGSVEVGSQTFQLLFDTGSNLLWIPSATCGSACAPHPGYTGPYTPLNKNFQIIYGSGNVSGTYGDAPVTLGGATLASFTVGLATEVNLNGYSSSDFDGLLGLAWPMGRDRSFVESIIPTLYQQGKIGQNLFAMYLTPDGSGGEMSIGEIDTTRYVGSISWLPLIEEAWWTIAVTSIKAGSRSVSSGTGTAIVDSGTTLMIGPDDEVDAMISAIQSLTQASTYYDASADMYYLSCSNAAALPTLNFTLMGADYKEYFFTLSGEAYVLNTISTNPNRCYIALSKSGSLSGGSPVDWILGDPFMRAFYSIYDYSQTRIGLAVAAGSGGVTGGGSTRGVSHMSGYVFAVLLVVFSALAFA